MRFAIALSLVAACAWGQEGTGPFPAILEQDPSLATHTVYRPQDLSKVKGKMPIIAWGNGGCANNGLSHRNFLMEIASHGYLAIAIGPPIALPAQGKGAPKGGDAKAPPADAAKGKGKAGGGTTPALAAAWSANPGNPPNYYDLPVVDGEYRADIGAKWYANSPLAMVDQYWTNLKKYKAIMVDVGLQDGLIGGNRDMVASLTRLGIPHVFETYEGDHTSRVKERFETKVFPFFSKNLDFPAR